MWSPTRTPAFRNNVPMTRSSCPTRSSWDSRTSTPSPSTFTSSPKSAGSPSPSSVKTAAKLPSLVQRRRSTIDATKHNFPFADLNEEDAIIAELALAGTPMVQRNTNGVTDANFKAHPHLLGECLAHPWGCDCEKVQQPTVGQKEAWQAMALRYKAVHGPALCTPSAAAKPKLERREIYPLTRRTAVFAPSSPGANAPFERLRSAPLPHHANAPHVEDLREREPRGAKSIEKVLSRLPARSTGPSVLATPPRVAQRLKPTGHDSRAGAPSRYGAAKDAIDVHRTSRVRASVSSKTVDGVRTTSF
ncbi:hypothetical protein T484DRAFT_3636491 [Baffinella frigidus]|nr:hypothetical protein T484DRAFT_3636491 [Cryptophyta sp. CCMP2293]